MEAAFADAVDALPSQTLRPVEIALRRELWRLQNDAVRKARKAGALPEEPETLSLGNLERLHALLQTAEPTDAIELGELTRALRRFGEAKAWFARAEPRWAPMAAFLGGLADAGDHRVAQIPDAALPELQGL